MAARPTHLVPTVERADPEAATCACCGTPVNQWLAAGVHRARQHAEPRCGLCGICHDCEGVHGDEFERRNRANAAAAAQRGKAVGWHVVAVQAVEDAHMTGRLMIDPRGGFWVDYPPPRWLVVGARAVAEGQQPALDDVLEAVLAPHLRRDATPTRIAEIERDMADAMRMVDPNIVSIEMETTAHTVEANHLVFKIAAKTSTIGGVNLAPDVEIPTNVLRLEPAKA